ncbi:hypothetical protein ACO2Q9_14615 [Variovorax sp. VNK109]|uniref:hypothetical protein n=1 Tax=Variovorax sp. VNK109 TaxID=3400919 RepID=UPI003C060CC8
MNASDRVHEVSFADDVSPVADQAGADTLHELMNSPLYQVRRVLRVTQMAWELPVARGKKAARLARRTAHSVPVLSAPRPGAFASLCVA